MLMNRTAVC